MMFQFARGKRVLQTTTWSVQQPVTLKLRLVIFVAAKEQNRYCTGLLNSIGSHVLMEISLELPTQIRLLSRQASVREHWGR